MTAGKAFFDTNVLLYIYSNADPHKQVTALRLYREHAHSGRMLLSTQVVQEFIVSALRKLALPQPQVRDLARTLLDSPLIVVGATHIEAALENAARYQISFWDALILAAAKSGGAEVLYTEDLNHGQTYDGVMVRNPFRSADPLPPA